MKKIKLNSRDCSINYLEEVDANRYRLIADTYVRVGFLDDIISFVDPSGGPFISVKDTIEGAEELGTLIKIEHIDNEGIFLIFKK